MIWPFRKRAPKPAHVGPETVDWRIGDIAECLSDNWHGEHNPKTGDKLMVKSVDYLVVTSGRDLGCSMFMLRFVGYDDAYGQEYFRKLTLTDTGADRKVARKTPVSA